jgi:hypothetical protein
MSTTILALRCIIPRALLAILGAGMRSSPELSDVGWRLVIVGPLLRAVGVYILIRNRH